MARGNKQAGQALVFSAFMLAALLGFVGLGIDVATLRTAQRKMQLAADSGAIAGAAEIVYGDVTTAAQADAGLNGYTNGVNGATVTVNAPPLSGAHSGVSGYVEVIVARSQPTFFAKIFGITSEPVSARAVATQTSGPACIWAINPTASQSYVASGSATLNANCGVMDLSNSSTAYVDSGGACTNATSIGIVGGYTQNACSTPANPTTNMIPETNPLAYLSSETPAVGACTYTNYPQINNTPAAPLSPGVYCGGITVSGNGTTATFSTGLYILNGGGLTVSGGANAIGNNVTFYNTGNSTYQYKPIVVSGGSGTSLIAQTTGTYAGILFFQDPTISSSSQNTISGGSTTVIQGSLYFPTTPLVYSGGSAGTAAYTIVVANTITISGNSSFGDNYSSLPGGVSPIRNAALVE
jgi:hypothetical protein